MKSTSQKRAKKKHLLTIMMILELKKINQQKNGGVRTFSTVYNEYKAQLEELYNEYDKDSKGYLDIETATNFLREMGCVGNAVDIALRGMDAKHNGRITKEAIFDWCYHKAPQIQPNPVLDQEALAFGWLQSREERLLKRKGVYEELMEIEKLEHNYNGVFHCDMRLGILDYCLEKKVRKVQVKK